MKEKKKKIIPQENCKKCEEYLQGWKRALADYKNMKNDLDRLKEENRARVKIELAHTLLPVIDNFEQAVGHVPHFGELSPESERAIEPWLQGVIFIQKQFEDALGELGIEKIEVGEEVDPNLHEVVGEADEPKVVLSGWKLADRILRPAKIIVKKSH